MTSSKDTLTVAEFRVLMQRVPAQGDRCSCGAVFEAGYWTVINWTTTHQCYPRYPAETASATALAADAADAADAAAVEAAPEA